MLFNENRDFKNNAENLSKSGGRALGSLMSKIHSLKDIGFTTFEKLFYSCVAPVIDYCSGVWGYQNFHSLDQVQDRAARYFLGTHRLAPLLAVRGETGWALLAPDTNLIWSAFGTNFRQWTTTGRQNKFSSGINALTTKGDGTAN